MDLLRVVGLVADFREKEHVPFVVARALDPTPHARTGSRSPAQEVERRARRADVVRTRRLPQGKGS